MTKKQLTRDEEADEIVKRLQKPPINYIDIEKEILEALSAEISAEIDKAILE